MQRNFFLYKKHESSNSASRNGGIRQGIIKPSVVFCGGGWSGRSIHSTLLETIKTGKPWPSPHFPALLLLPSSHSGKEINSTVYIHTLATDCEPLHWRKQIVCKTFSSCITKPGGEIFKCDGGPPSKNSLACSLPKLWGNNAKLTPTQSVLMKIL